MKLDMELEALKVLQGTLSSSSKGEANLEDLMTIGAKMTVGDSLLTKSQQAKEEESYLLPPAPRLKHATVSQKF